MKPEDIENQELQRLRQKANEPIGFKVPNWVLWIALAILASLVIWLVFFKPDNPKLIQEKQTNDRRLDSIRSVIEANINRNESNDASNDKDAENVHNKAKEAHKRITRPIGKPNPVEMEVMYDELLNRKEL